MPRFGRHIQLALAGALVVLAGTTLGCSNRADDCELNGICSGGAGACEGPPDPSNINEDCGVFVDANAASSGKGTRAAPYKSLQEAIDKASGRRVYACKGQAFDEALVVTSELDLYGGFDCSSWSWDSNERSPLTSPEDTIPLRVESSAKRAHIEGFLVTARAAASPGSSSIAAVFESELDVSVARSGFVAGAGANGIDGQLEGTRAKDGNAAEALADDQCVNGHGGEGAKTTCSDGPSTGGTGGEGSMTTGGSGTDGLPHLGAGEGGEGQQPNALCDDGHRGKDGGAGDDGEGAFALGKLTPTGVQGGDGKPGLGGSRGQGGGGGGGSAALPPCIDGLGPGGGGGGAGGCGGKGGAAGTVGGSSIGIVSLTTQLQLEEVTIAVGAAGNGGRGVSGQLPGDGGGGLNGGQGPSEGCHGGDGGDGGTGGRGGGGRGGHAIGVALAGPLARAVEPLVAEGSAGEGGDDALGGLPGGAGTASACWDFQANDACEG